MRVALPVAVVAATTLVGLTLAVVLVDGPLPGELAVIDWLQGFGQPVPAFADVVRATTGTEGNLLLGLPGAVWLVRTYGTSGALAVCVCLVSMLVVQPVAKEVIDRDRPTADQVEVRAEHSSRAYPSGHSLSTTTVFGTMALLSWRRGRRRLAGAAMVPIVCTAIASGIHGVHWASDAIAGTIIGAGAAVVAVRLLVYDRSTD